MRERFPCGPEESSMLHVVSTMPEEVFCHLHACLEAESIMTRDLF